MTVNSFLRGFAHFCVWITPLQIFFFAWSVWIIIATDYTIGTLSILEFYANYFAFIMPIIDWLYTWFWNAYLDFFLSFPLIIVVSLKGAFSTWIGFWILKNVKKEGIAY
jgi:hypothetical protein